MSDNTLTAVTPKLLAQGLMALRQNAIMPRLVNRGYEDKAGERGSTIDVPIPSAIAVQQVAPGPVPTDQAGVSPTSVPIPLTEWYEAPFHMTDKDMLTAMEGTIPMQASEAIKSLANKIDADLLALTKLFYNQAGTAGTAIFPTGDNKNDITTALTMRKLLNNSLAPLEPRHVVMDPNMEAEALNQRAFNDMSWQGEASVIDGQFKNKRLGFQWWLDQNSGIPFTTGFTTTGAISVNAGVAAGLSTVTFVAGAGETFRLNVNDVFTFSNHTQQYIVTGGAAAGNTISATTGVITFYPPLQTAITTSETLQIANVTINGVVYDTKSVTLCPAFHRDAIAFATRPLARVPDGLGSITQTAVDEISGLSLRLEVTRENKRIRFSYDVLYGYAVIRRELGGRFIR